MCLDAGAQATESPHGYTRKPTERPKGQKGKDMQTKKNGTTTITIEVKRPDWFEKFLKDNTHLEARESRPVYGEPVRPEDVHATEARPLTPIERRTLNGEFEQADNRRAARRSILREFEMAYGRVRGRSRDSIDSNKRNAKRQRRDVELTRSMRLHSQMETASLLQDVA